MNKAVLAILFIAVFGGGLGVGFLGGVWWQNITTYTPNPYDFAIVFATGGLGDKSFNDGCYAGALNVSTKYNLNFTYSEPTYTSQYEGMLRAYASHAEYSDPYKIIISIGFDQADALMAVAADYKDQNFAIVDMFIDPGTYPRVASLLFNENEGSALVGALAGLYTANDKIGFVGGFNIELIRKFAVGYFWGANKTNPTLDVRTNVQGAHLSFSFVNNWADPTTAQTQADGQYTAGADIIFAAAGRSGLGVIASAKTNNASFQLGCWAIGVDSPQMYLGCADPDNPAAPTVVLTSMLKRVDVAIYNMVKDACVDFDFTGGVKTFSLANQGVGWEINDALLTNPIPQAYKNQINMIQQGIINGTYTVPGPDAFSWLMPP